MIPALPRPLTRAFIFPLLFLFFGSFDSSLFCPLILWLHSIFNFAYQMSSDLSSSLSTIALSTSRAATRQFHLHPSDDDDEDNTDSDVSQTIFLSRQAPLTPLSLSAKINKKQSMRSLRRLKRAQTKPTGNRLTRVRNFLQIQDLQIITI